MAMMSQLLDEALPLDEAGRRAWLRRLSPEHRYLASALRRALLPEAAETVRVSALMTLPKLGSPDEAKSASGLKPGARVGPYELIRPLGSGGMAEVWLARRADGAFTREVALKLPIFMHRRGDLEPRFARERDILASLEHPQIARLYDAGVDAQAPYLAMEYVRGEPLNLWCDTHHLPIAARLALFLQVLEAVQYAHETQVIHRDLKPSNILVSTAGQVRLLDFGIAKLLEAEDADQPALTSVHGQALTPDYASPELLRGDPIDERSDLYSLGVLLYELLTGTRPYRLKSAASIGLLDQAMATLEVKKPSIQLEATTATTVTNTPEQWARQLRGDLDAIVLKALAKDPAGRYPSAAAFAADLRRYLEGKPIQAQPARIPYRVRKFVGRHRSVLWVSAVAGVAILAMVGYSLYRETRMQAAVSANVSAFAPPEHSIAVLPFLDMSEKKDQGYFSDGLSEELIDLLAQIQDLQVIARTSSFYFKGKQVTIAEIAKTLNVAHVLEGSVRKSGDTLRVTAQLIRADNGYHLWSKTYDRNIKDIFKVQDEIAAAVVEALKAKLASTQPVAPHRSSNTEAYNQYLLGRQFQERGNPDSWRRAIEAYRRVIALDPRYAAAYASLAHSESFLADSAGDAAGLRQAEADAEQAIALGPEEADGYSVRGFLRSSFSWDWMGAQADFAKALILDPASPGVQINYANLLESIGRLPEAIAAAKKAIEPDPLSNFAWERLGRYLMYSREYPAAAEALRRSLEIRPDSSFGLDVLATLQLLEGKAADALMTARKIDDEATRLPAIAMARHTLGNAKESQQALEELVDKHAQDSAYQIAEVFGWYGNKDKAFEWLERAYQQRDGGLANVKVDPLLESVHGDPRYTALLGKMKLPE